MENNIDILFKKALRDRKSEPPPHVWDRIQQQLDNRRRSRKIIAWSFSAAAIALLLSVSWLLQIRNDAQEDYLVSSIPFPLKEEIKSNPETPVKEVNLVNHSEKIKENTMTLAALSPITKTSDITTEKENSRETGTPVQIRNNTNSVVVDNTTQEVSLKTNTIRRNFIPLTSKASIENNKAYQELLKMNNTTTPVAKEEDKEKIKFSLSGHIAPVYSSGNYNSSVKNTKGYEYSSDQMSGVVNVSGGLKLSLAANKRFSVQTGLFYTKIGQRTKENNVYIPRTAAARAAAGSGNYVSTPLGNIKSKSNVIIYKSEGEAGLSNSSDDGSIEQLFGSLEIPLTVKYRLNDNKVRFSVLGGFSGSFIVDNQAYLRYNNKKEEMGSTEDIRNFNVTTDLGIGVEYPITRKIKIMLEPGFKYYLQSLSRNRDIDFKPYTFSFSTGIGIDF